MASIFRDYLDVVASLLNSPDTFVIFQVTVLFWVKSLLNCIVYIISFGWLKDILYLPLVLPKWQELIYYEDFFYEDLNWAYFQNILTDKTNIFVIFVIGFLNSFFCSLPLSTTHLLATRRLFLHGLAPAVASTGGIILGQCLYIMLTLFGIRSAIIPWVSWDPLTYICGVVLLWSTIYSLTTEQTLRSIKWSEKSVLIRLFFQSFLLTWTEQAIIYQYIINLNFSNQPNILSSHLDFGAHLYYIFGLLLGHCFFGGLFLFIGLFVKQNLLVLIPIPYTFVIRRMDSGFLILILGFSISIFPYYGFDYLLTKPLGFFSQEKFVNSYIFPQHRRTDKGKLLVGPESFPPHDIDTDISYFDRGNYGQTIDFFRRHSEELNFQAEYAWTTRWDRTSNLNSGSGKSAQSSILRVLNIDDEQTQEKKEALLGDEYHFYIQRLKHSDKTNPSVPSITDMVNLSKRYELGSSSLSITEKDLDPYLDRDMGIDSRISQNVNDNTGMKDNLYLNRIAITGLGHRINDFLIPRLKNNMFFATDTFTFEKRLIRPKAVIASERYVKFKFHKNLVYKTLLNLEMDAYLNREPKDYHFHLFDEAYLCHCRYWLSKYHDTLRAYQSVPYLTSFYEKTGGSKSFVDRAYNHKFKGSMKVIRKLVALKPKREVTDFDALSYRFDQTLFENGQGPFLNHEELSLSDLISSKIASNDPMTKSQEHTWNAFPDLGFYANLEFDSYSQKDKEKSLSWRDFENHLHSGSEVFLELDDSTPFYLGWDNETRQMIFTKRFVSQNKNIYLQNSSQIQKFLKNPDTSTKDPLVFTTWPLPKDVLTYFKSKQKNTVMTLYEPTSNPGIAKGMKKILGSGNVLKEYVEPIEGKQWPQISHVPNNLKFLHVVHETPNPDRIGFVWPGTVYLNQYRDLK